MMMSRCREKITKENKIYKKTDKVGVREMCVDGVDDTSSQHVNELISCR